MPKLIITKLTEEQKAMIPIYRDKWRAIEMSTESIDREKAAAVIKAAYVASDYSEPEIVFYSNPLTAIEQVLAMENFKVYLGRDIHIKFLKRVLDHVRHGIRQQLSEELLMRLRNQIQFPEFPYYPTESNPQISYFPDDVIRYIEQQLITDLRQSKQEFADDYGADVSYLTTHLHRPAQWAIWGCVYDFCISVLALHHDKKKWRVIQELIQHSGLIFQFEKVCIACDGPCKLSFDEENMLHAEGEPALQFADGYSVYACHGIHPSERDLFDKE